jgi:mycothiol S-conjugate amidase
VPERCLLTIHAHPDDESSKGAGTVARYAAEGVRTVLVCCTGGEAGDILNPAADSEEARADLAAVRRRELEEAVAVIGCFARADLDEAVGRVVRIVRDERPQVVVAYGPSDGGRGHPDHLRVHEVAVAAFERAGDPSWYADAGEPWEPSKLYYVGVFSRTRLQAQHHWLVGQGLESPWAERLDAMADRPDRTTTRVHVGDHLDVGRKALIAHRTQIAPDGHWFRIPLDVMAELHPYEDYELGRSRVPVVPRDGAWEDDLFAGIVLRE